jgi:hypothetical protein
VLQRFFHLLLAYTKYLALDSVLKGISSLEALTFLKHLIYFRLQVPLVSLSRPVDLEGSKVFKLSMSLALWSLEGNLVLSAHILLLVDAVRKVPLRFKASFIG